MKKLLAFILLVVFPTATFGAYNEIDCSIDPVFSENSCNQCFEGGAKMQGDLLGLLSDLWMNVTEVQKILYLEEQVDPEMVNLAGNDVEWIQTPNEEDFWEFTDELKALYSELDEGYILDAGKSVTWIKSGLSHAYKLATNTAEAGTNIGLLVYPITTHNIEDGEIIVNSAEHKECVLFKSGEAAPEEPVERLPDTGPKEFMLLMILAAILGFGVLKFRTRS